MDISVWYDIMPTGEWWNYTVKHIPNLLLVYRETPEKIFNTTIGFPVHKSDIVRLEAVLTLGISQGTLGVRVSRTDNSKHKEFVMFH